VLGLGVEVKWAELGASDGSPDFVLVDADLGWDGLLNWPPSENPMPVIALLSSEAPGRIAWALAAGANSLIAKPVSASAIYPALVMAQHHHGVMRSMADRIGELEERVRLRPLVIRAVEAIMAAERTDEAGAYRHLRREAMRSRQTVEQLSATILAGTSLAGTRKRPAAG